VGEGRRTERITIPRVVIELLEHVVGHPFRTLVIIGETGTGQPRTYVPDWINPADLVDLLNDAAHDLAHNGH
jgi:hypothetical protein